MSKFFSFRNIAFGLPASLFIVNLILTVALYIDDPMRTPVIGPYLSAAMHFSGGVTMAILFFYFVQKIPELKVLLKKYAVILILALGFVALAGVLWELYEYFLDITLGDTGILPFVQSTIDDTMADFFFDLLGGLATSIIVLKVLRKGYFK
ncbi:MAG: hypothetical protein Q8R26_00155 [bacterium]|nr:hypothetical protein [bacterium]